MTILGVRFGHVAFRVAEVERNVKWYADAFGARKVFHGGPQAGRQEVMFLEFAPGQHIEIFTNGTERSQTTSDAIGYRYYCLVADDIDAAIRHLATMNVHPERRPVGEGRAHTGSLLSPSRTARSSNSWRIRLESAIYHNSR